MHVAKALLLENGAGPSLAATVLRRENLAVVTVNSIEAARKALEPGGFDIWLVALAGEKDPSWELVELAATELPEGACLLVVGEDTPEAFDRAIASGAFRFLPEPLREPELMQALRQGLDYVHLCRDNQALRREASLFEMIKNIALAMDLDKLQGLIMDASMRLTEAGAGALLLQAEDGQSLKALATVGIDDASQESGFFGLPTPYLMGVLRGGNPIRLSPGSQEARGMRCGSSPVESALIAPLVVDGQGIGMTVVVRTEPPPLDGSSLRALARLAEDTAPAIWNALSVHRTQELIIKDDLTQAYNRRYFEDELDEEINRSRRYGTNLSLIFLDVDNLKAVNNAHGHFVGSKVLQEVAQRIILTVRGIDRVVRYGGDEFCVILPETDSEGSNRVAERIRENVAQAPFLVKDGLDISMTVSLGIACCPTHATTKEDLVKQADKAMFRSKDAAKNSVTVAS